VSARLALAAVVLVCFAFAGCSSRVSGKQEAAWNADIKRLEAEQDSLRQRAAVLVAADPKIQRLPPGDIVISVPTKFLRDVIQRVFDQVATSVTLRLGGIKAHVAKSVKKIVKIGDFVVDVDIKEITARLEPEQPAIGFTGNKISMSLPIGVNEGYGKASIHFIWNGKHIADLTCGDMDITEVVTATVVPARYVVTGTLGLALEGSHVMCTPRFPPNKLRIRVAPTKESWATINKILEEKHGVCGWVLDKVDVPSILKNVVEGKGFNVALPLSKVKAFAIPAGVSDSVTVNGRVLAVETKTNTVRIEPDVILYSADAALKSADAPLK
jgi:hypothetical protein